jgi:hypothetical protein
MRAFQLSFGFFLGALSVFAVFWFLFVYPYSSYNFRWIWVGYTGGVAAGIVTLIACAAIVIMSRG